MNDVFLLCWEWNTLMTRNLENKRSQKLRGMACALTGWRVQSKYGEHIPDIPGIPEPRSSVLALSDPVGQFIYHKTKPKCALDTTSQDLEPTRRAGGVSLRARLSWEHRVVKSYRERKYIFSSFWGHIFWKIPHRERGGSIKNYTRTFPLADTYLPYYFHNTWPYGHPINYMKACTQPWRNIFITRHLDVTNIYD